MSAVLTVGENESTERQRHQDGERRERQRYRDRYRQTEKKRDGDRERQTGRQEKREIDTHRHRGPTFTASSVWPQFIAGLTGTLVAAQCVEAPLLTTSSVRFGTLIFFYTVREMQSN